MLLTEWLEQEGMTRSAFAIRVGLNPSDVTGICNGTQWVSARTALAIENETAGKVTVSDILDAYRNTAA